ncbi:hypothetical protein BST81_01330 [Leptolyngbya sp. 'hensonii']|uniref:response regulator n=1 Tax=Leptolyngbya sp. 'hensonii' TaxID=1922337 RepID=UPI00095031AC|nr:response regulator [Leptolyngbya sp. 'hensonii']OLP20398.1 hypothetical protein BST81_01330 [Leptolyngbya sp. 'hensonii']
MIDVLLVDDQRVIREGLKALLESSTNIRVAGVAENGQAAIQQVEALHPDVALIDIHMPVMNGVAATRIISQRFQKTKVLILSSEDDDQYLAEALQAGARGYLLKNSSAEELMDAIDLIYRGHSQVGPGLLEKIISRVAIDPASTEPVMLPIEVSELTPVELELMRLFQGFNPLDLKEFVHLSLRRQNLDTLMHRLKKQLEQTPTNLSALYLAGACSRQLPDHQSQALDYLRLGFREAERQQRPWPELLLFCREGGVIDLAEVYTWVQQIRDRWRDDELGRQFLRETAALFGEESLYQRMLLAQWQISSLTSKWRHLTELQPTIDRLQQGFKRLHQDTGLPI